MKQKKRTWLWVIGWIVAFPVPLTLLLVRKKEEKTIIKVLKYGLIVFAWLFYIAFIFADGDTKSKPNTIPESPSVEAEQDTKESGNSKADSENPKENNDSSNTDDTRSENSASSNATEPTDNSNNIKGKVH